jgi:TetR/AcrR family transcriptional repressor of mexJK operon
MTIKKTAKRTGGRPSRVEADRLPDKIMDAAAHLFFQEGYGATSIEAIAKRAQISKRTFYHRFADKPAVFEAVVHRLIGRLRPAQTQNYFEGKNLEEILLVLAKLILQGAMSPQSLALNRIILAEALRFPELALIVNEQGMRKEAIQRIAALLGQQPHGKDLTDDKAAFAAEQFLHMVTSVPQRRALGLGQPMTQKELDAWAKDTVTLFLHGWA